MGTIFSGYGPVEGYHASEVKPALIPVTLKSYNLDPTKTQRSSHFINCGCRNLFVVVEGRRSQCWVCREGGLLANLSPRRNPAPQSQQTPEQTRLEAPRKPTSGAGVWTAMVRRGAKVTTPLPTEEGQGATAETAVNVSVAKTTTNAASV